LLKTLLEFGEFPLEEEGFAKKAYEIQQVATIASAKAPEYTIDEYKNAILQCFRLGKDPSHTMRPIKMVFKSGHK
jgi:hypothetical protein